MAQLVLLKAHTHARVAHLAGERIEVDCVTAQWLLAHAVAAPVSFASEPAAKAGRPLHPTPSHQPTFKKEIKP